MSMWAVDFSEGLSSNLVLPQKLSTLQGHHEHKVVIIKILWRLPCAPWRQVGLDYQDHIIYISLCASLSLRILLEAFSLPREPPSVPALVSTPPTPLPFKAWTQFNMLRPYAFVDHLSFATSVRLIPWPFFSACKCSAFISSLFRRKVLSLQDLIEREKKRPPIFHPLILEQTLSPLVDQEMEALPKRATLQS